MSQEWFIFHAPGWQEHKSMITPSVIEEVRKLVLWYIVWKVGEFQIYTFEKPYEELLAE